MTIAASLTFRDLFRQVPGATAVITATDDAGEPTGATCTAICAVSPHPESLLVCLDQGSNTLAALTRSRTFAVNFLGNGAEEAAQVLSTKSPDKFARVDWTPSAVGNPILSHVLAVAECTVEQTYVAGDHTIVIGLIDNAHRGSCSTPLIYHDRQFHYLQVDHTDLGAR